MSTKKTNTKTKTTPTAPAATQATKGHPGVTIRWLTPEEAAEKYGGGFSFVGSRPFRPTSTNPPTPTPDQGGK